MLLSKTFVTNKDNTWIIHTHEFVQIPFLVRTLKLGLVMNTKHPLFLPFRIEHRHFYIKHSLFITFKSQPKRRTNACVNIYIAGFD